MIALLVTQSASLNNLIRPEHAKHSVGDGKVIRAVIQGWPFSHKAWRTVDDDQHLLDR